MLTWEGLSHDIASCDPCFRSLLPLLWRLDSTVLAFCHPVAAVAGGWMRSVPWVEMIVGKSAGGRNTMIKNGTSQVKCLRYPDAVRHLVGYYPSVLRAARRACGKYRRLPN